MSNLITAIDSDGHIYERQEEIRPYLDDRWKNRHTAFWPGSYQAWDVWMQGKLESGYCFGSGKGLNAAQQVETWIRALDEHEIEQAVLFSTGSGNVPKIAEPDFAVAMSHAVNAHFAADYGCERLHPMGELPLMQPEAAARELEHAVNDLGLKGFEVLTDGLPLALGDPFYDPIYEAAQECGATIAIHGSRHWAHEWGSTKLKTFAEVHAFGFPAGIMLNFTSVICQGVPVRFPNLKMCFLETGATWLPFYLDRLDEHWEKRGAEEMPHLDRSPSDTFRDSRIKVSIEGKETLLRETIDYVGAEHLMYATDLPHWDGEFPENLEGIRNSGKLSAAEKQALLYDNAKEVYGLQ